MSGLRLIKRPPPAGRQFEFWRGQVAKRLQPVADRRANEYNRAVAHFQAFHRPKFEGNVLVERDRIHIQAVMTNGGQVIDRYGTFVLELWEFWNKGTRPHIIRPRFASVLRFVVDSGEIVFTKLVRHPGTRGSGAKRRIDRRTKIFERGIEQAGRVAFGLLQRFNRR